MNGKFQTVLTMMQIVAMIMMGVAYYYSDRTDSQMQLADLKIKFVVVEQRVSQELLGYADLQKSFYRQQEEFKSELHMIASKLDCLADKRFCGK